MSHAFVAISCSSVWTGIPDVRFANIAEPVTNLDHGGGTTGKLPSTLFEGLDIPGSGTTLFTFSFEDGQHVIAKWNAVLIQQELFVEISEEPLPSGIKEGFVALLDYIEETLQATTMTLCISKNMPFRAETLRVFMFLGFGIINPGYMKHLSNTSNHLFMNYSFD